MNRLPQANFPFEGRLACHMAVIIGVLGGCGEPVFENAGSVKSLDEDRSTCAMEMDKRPEALAYRHNPDAYPEYVSQAFEVMNQCIERKGWRQVRSPQELKQIHDALASEAQHTLPPASIADSKSTDAFVQGVEARLARTSNTTQ